MLDTPEAMTITTRNAIVGKESSRFRVAPSVADC
jgi:hypothetical protein